MFTNSREITSNPPSQQEKTDLPTGDKVYFLKTGHRKPRDKAPYGICLADAKTGIIIECNEALAQMVERDKSELIGKHQRILHPPSEHLGKFSVTFEQHRCQDEGTVLAAQLITKVGAIKAVEIQANRLALSGKAIMHGIFREVPKTDHQAVSLQIALSNYHVLQKKLLERERLLNFAIQQMPIPVIIARAPDVKIRKINLSAVDLMVKKHGDLRKLPMEEHREYWPTFYPDGTPYRVEDLPLTRAIVNGESTRNEEVIIRKEDGDRIISTSAAPLYDGQGRIVAGIVAFPDITEQKQAEQALAASEKRYRRQFEEAKNSERKYRELVENANSIILRMDARGNILFFNEFAQKFFGYAEDEILGKNVVGTIVPPMESTGRSLEVMIAEISKDPDRYANNENENIRRNGERVWVTWTNKPIYNDKGDIVETLCIGKDITEQKRVELALEKSRRKLQVLYSRLINSQEDERKRIALELHDDLGQALVVLKLKIQSIQNQLPVRSQALIRDTGETLRYLNELMEKVRGLSHNLTPGFLDDLDLTVSVQSIADAFVRHTHMQVYVDTENVDHLFASTAKISIYRIFQEVFQNIEKHSRAKTVRIRNKRRGKNVSFMIADDGRGFDMEKVESRGPSERSLGLASIDERVRMMGGHLNIDTREGKGTRITFTVPIKSGKSVH